MRQRTLWIVCCAMVLSFCLPESTALGEKKDATEAEVKRLRKALLAQDPDATFGLRVRQNHPARLAIERLVEIGTPQAVGAIRDFLTSYGMPHELKTHALVALGRIGTKEAVAAIGEFDKWARQILHKPPPFRFGSKDCGIDHYAPVRLRPLATATDEKGRIWAAFAWDRLGKLDLWLTRAIDKKGKEWAQPGLAAAFPDRTLLHKRGKHFALAVNGDAVTFTAGPASLGFSLKTIQADRDKDGLPDLVELRLGTKPDKADTDGDGIADGADSNPLTPKHTATDDETQIRQAVFGVLFATSDSQNAVVTVTHPWGRGGRGKTPAAADAAPFAKQEYYGFGGVVLRSTRTRKGFVNLTGMKVQVHTKMEATVQINDWAGSEAASTHEAKLKRIHGKWVVVSFQMTLIS